MPSFSALIISEDGEHRLNSAFVPFYTFGIQLQWKALAFFCEGRWGSANYKIDGLNDDNDWDEYYSDKVSCRNSGLRAGIGICF